MPTGRRTGLGRRDYDVGRRASHGFPETAAAVKTFAAAAGEGISWTPASALSADQ